MCSGLVWYGMLQYVMAWHGMAWHGMAWHGISYHGMAWNDMDSHGLAWLGMVQNRAVQYSALLYSTEWYGSVGTTWQSAV